MQTFLLVSSPDPCWPKETNCTYAMQNGIIERPLQVAGQRIEQWWQARGSHVLLLFLWNVDSFYKLDCVIAVQSISCGFTPLEADLQCFDWLLLDGTCPSTASVS